MAMVFRGLRWKQTLAPLGEKPRASVCVNAIFLSYAVSLVIPRVGEFARCGVLARHDHTDFAKALGTVVTERAVDMIIMLLFTLTAFLLQVKVFGTFFSRTGTRLDDIIGMDSTHYLRCGGSHPYLSGAQAAVVLQQDKANDAQPHPGHTVIGECQQRSAVYLLQSVDMDLLFPALLSHLLLLRLHVEPGTDLCSGELRRGVHSGDSAYAEWCGPMAFQREDDAGALWCRRQ